MTDPILIQKILDEVATPREIHLFREMLQGMDEQEYTRCIDVYLNRAGGTATADSDKWRDAHSLEILLQKIQQQQTATPAANQAMQPRIHRVHVLKTAWFKYAAAVVLLAIGIALYYNFYPGPSETRVVQNMPAAVPADVAPATNKAVLTLSNGRQVQLSNDASETIKDRKIAIENKNGILVYSNTDAGMQGQAIATNTMTTPNGGLYKLTLSDGTKVWLDAASSITYPVAFGEIRKVSITGEVYFEVAKDRKRPFLVDVNGTSTVEVLGTSFNINSYANEETVRTTLLDGAVRVMKAGQSAILTQGQQAIYANSNQPGIKVKTDADINQVMAWRMGLFTFNNADLPYLMRQLERWYDIKVTYRNKAPGIILKGKMYRNVNLSDVLEFLKTLGVATRMEGKTLIVL